MKQKILTIPKGSHGPEDKIDDGYIGVAKALKGYFELDSSFYYSRPGRDADWMDISKLVGLSHGHHLSYSWRIGFRPDFDNRRYIILYAFAHGPEPVTPNAFFNKDRGFSFVELGRIKVKNRYYFEINLSDRRFLITGNGQEIEQGIHVVRPEGLLSRWGYVLNPYHGGNKPAPQTMRCKILWDIVM